MVSLCASLPNLFHLSEAGPARPHRRSHRDETTPVQVSLLESGCETAKMNCGWLRLFCEWGVEWWV